MRLSYPSGVQLVFTIGHSTHALDAFVGLLNAHEVRALVDVRSTPKSRRMPHFSKESLTESLPERGIDYLHLKELGGWRRPLRDSPNTGWTSKGFQGYADHMTTAEFQEALDRLMSLAGKRRTAFMCAEGLWWRCHRRLLSDALLVRGWTVCHIDPAGELHEHALPEFAVVDGERLTYPAPQRSLNL